MLRESIKIRSCRFCRLIGIRYVFHTIASFSSIILIGIIVTTFAPICSTTKYAEATAGTSTPSTLSFVSTNSVASASLTVDSSTGTFATSDNNQKVAFSVSTNNYTGYTLTLKSSGTNTALSDGNNNTISTIPSSTTLEAFSSSSATGQALNNKWGYIPNYYNSAINTTNYYPSPTSANTATLRTTSTANSANGVDNPDSYTIGIGFRMDFNSPSGTYTNDTFILEIVANPIAYSIVYDDNTGDSSISGIPSTPTAGSTAQTSVALSNSVPTRTNYTFKSWCLGTVSNDGTVCTGTEFNSGASFGIDQTSNNTNVTLYATWTAVNPTLSITFGGVGVSSVKVCTVSGDCTGANLKGTISTSGGTINSLINGTTYYLYATYTTGHTLNNWEKTSVSGALAGNTAINTTTTSSNPTFTMGAGNNTITITGKAATYNLVITADAYVSSFSIKAGSTSGTNITCGKSSTTFTCADLSYGTNYYMYPVFASGYEFDSYQKTDSATNSALSSTSTENAYYTVGAGNGAITIASKIRRIYMWEATSSDCGSTLYDNRDGVERAYNTATINNLCWMTTNLALGVSTTVELSSTNTNIESAFTLPASSTSGFSSASARNLYNSNSTTCGNNSPCYAYYTWYTATAGTTGAHDICPKNWRLPTQAELNALRSSYNSDAAMTGSPFNAVHSGYYYNGNFNNGGTYGQYWSASRRGNSNNGIYYMRVSTSTGVSVNTINTYYGNSIRCVATLPSGS